METDTMPQSTNRNLLAAGKLLKNLAENVKILGFLSAGVGAISLLIGIVKSIDGGWGYTAIGITLSMVGVALLSIGVLLWIGSIFLAAMGEALISLVSIEANICQVNQTIQMVAGVPQMLPPIVAEKRCRQCGSNMESSAKFCEICGRKVE